MAPQRSFGVRRPATLIDAVPAVVATSVFFLFILLLIGNGGRLVAECTSVKWAVSLHERYVLGLTAAAACGTPAIILLYTIGFSGGRKRLPVMAATAYCGLAAFTLVLDAHNLLYRPCEIELGLHSVAFCSGIVVASVVYTTLDLHCGEKVATTVMHTRTMLTPVVTASLLYTAPRAILQAADGHPGSVPAAAVLCFVTIASFVYFALKGSADVERHLPPHWTVMLSGLQVLIAWVVVDVVHFCVSAGVPGVKPVHGLAVLQLHLVLEVIQISVSVSQAVMSYEESSRFKAERDVAQAELQSRIKSEEQARAAEDARQKFLRYIFHEIRVPFNSLDMGLGMILDDLASYAATTSVDGSPGFFLPDDAKGILDVMAKAANSMKVIMNDTLDWSKLQSGAFQISLGAMCLQDVVSATVMGLQAFANHRENRVQLVSYVDPRIPRWLLADKVRIQQVIANFLSNGIKFAPHDGTGVVSLRILPVFSGLQPHYSPARAVHAAPASPLADGQQPTFSPEGVWWKSSTRLSNEPSTAAAITEGGEDMVVIDSLGLHSNASHAAPTLAGPQVNSDCKARLQAEGLRIGGESSQDGPECYTLAIVVKDNGDGIHTGDIPSLFRAFRQLDVGMQYKGKGTGLGLAICHEIVSMHGGRVGVRSRGQKGQGAEFFIILKLPIVTAESNHLVDQAGSRHSVLNVGSSTGLYAGAQGLSSPVLRGHAAPGRSHVGSSLLSPLLERSILPGELELVPAAPGTADPSGKGSEGQDTERGSRLFAGGSPLPGSALEDKEHSTALGDARMLSRAPPLTCAGARVPSVVRILVVDDVLENRKMLAKALARRLPSCFAAENSAASLPVEVDEAEDGHIAVEMVTGRPAPGFPASDPLLDGGTLRAYDVITMDMEMPTVSGFAATRMLREAGYEGLIIGCTGNALEEDQQLFMDSGADAVFIKPVDVGLLAKSIVAVFRERREVQ